MSSRILVLALGAFAVGTSGYIVAGVLPQLSAQLNVSPGTAGLLVTAFALAYALGSPLLTVAAGRWERRKLLVAALLVTALGNALAAVAPSFGLLVLARIVTAVGAGVYTPAATGMAAGLAPADRTARAMAVVFGGLTIATIIGVPAGSLLVGSVGYRGVFALVAVAAVIAAIAVRLAVPTVAAPPVVGLRTRLSAAADRRALAVLGLSLLGPLGAFTVYTFIAPLLGHVTGVHGVTVSLLLVGYGIGGALGNVLGGQLTDRFGTRLPLIVAYATSVVVLALFPLLGQTVTGAAISLALWGAATWAVNPPLQRKIVAVNPAQSGLLLSLNASAIYLGVGLSGPIGGAVLGTGGLGALPVAGAVLFGLALALHLLTARRSTNAPVYEVVMVSAEEKAREQATERAEELV